MMTQLNRRHMMMQSACGFGSLATAAMLGQQQAKAATTLAHHAPRAKRIIFLFMQGGVSQVDSLPPPNSRVITFEIRAPSLT